MKHSLRLLLVAVSATVVASCRQQVSESVAPPSLSVACQAALAPGGHAQPIDRTISALQEKARQSSSKRDVLEQLGYQFVARARAANDPGDYILAERVATCLDEQQPGDPAALLLRGHALHQLHRFHEAEAIARTLVTKREFVLDYALLGDTLMEQGRLAEAATAYQKMIDLKPFYQSYTRAAHLRWLTGDLNGAIELTRKAIEAASPRNPEAIAWAYTRLGLYELQRGDAGLTMRAVDTALSFQPDYAAALLMRGRALLTVNRPGEAVRALEQAAKLNPLPEYQWTLAEALRRQGRESEAASVEQQLLASGTAVDPRTVALFLATRGIEQQHALELAERELTVRRDVFTEDAHAWTLASAGRFGEAGTAMERALSAHTNDARLFLHAGIIAAATGRQTEARRWLDQAELLRSTLLPSELDILQSHRSSLQNARAGRS